MIASVSSYCGVAQEAARHRAGELPLPGVAARRRRMAAWRGMNSGTLASGGIDREAVRRATRTNLDARDCIGCEAGTGAGRASGSHSGPPPRGAADVGSAVVLVEGAVSEIARPLAAKVGDSTRRRPGVAACISSGQAGVEAVTRPREAPELLYGRALPPGDVAR